MLRAFCDECVFLEDEAKALFTSSACWDIKGFYDTLQIEQILKEGLRLGLPPIFLLLESILHLGPRLLRKKGCYGPVLQPTRSIVAGARRAVDFSRCVLYALLEDVANRFEPTVISSTWVDDVT